MTVRMFYNRCYTACNFSLLTFHINEVTNYSLLASLFSCRSTNESPFLYYITCLGLQDRNDKVDESRMDGWVYLLLVGTLLIKMYRIWLHTKSAIPFFISLSHRFGEVVYWVDFMCSKVTYTLLITKCEKKSIVF